MFQRVSLETVLNQLGIDRSVQELSYAEKEIARYIAIVQQGGQAQGDFARTMDSSANQIRIFQNQLAELKQVAGAFIMKHIWKYFSICKCYYYGYKGNTKIIC